MRILVVEDDRSMAKLVRLLLTEDGYAVDVTAAGEEGLMLARVNSYDALILDLGLPDRAGIAVLRALRAEGSRLPILILTARAGVEEVVTSLDAGADDYLIKPFANAELKARVRALVRRGGAVRTEQLSYGALVVNRLTRHALVAGTPLDLTAREFALLEHLALHPGEAVTRSTLLEAIWAHGAGGGYGIDNMLYFSATGPWTIVVLGNFNPPGATDVAAAIAKFVATSGLPGARPATGTR